MTGDITMQKKQNKNISLKNVQVQDGFWKPMQDLIIETVIPYQEKILNDEIPGVEKSHALANFRIAAGMEKGEFYWTAMWQNGWRQLHILLLCIRMRNWKNGQMR